MVELWLVAAQGGRGCPPAPKSALDQGGELAGGAKHPSPSTEACWAALAWAPVSTACGLCSCGAMITLGFTFRTIITSATQLSSVIEEVLIIHPQHLHHQRRHHRHRQRRIRHHHRPSLTDTRRHRHRRHPPSPSPPTSDTLTPQPPPFGITLGTASAYISTEY